MEENNKKSKKFAVKIGKAVSGFLGLVSKGANIVTHFSKETEKVLQEDMGNAKQHIDGLKSKSIKLEEQEKNVKSWSTDTSKEQAEIKKEKDKTKFEKIETQILGTIDGVLLLGNKLLKHTARFTEKCVDVAKKGLDKGVKNFEEKIEKEEEKSKISETLKSLSSVSTSDDISVVANSKARKKSGQEMQ